MLPPARRFERRPSPPELTHQSQPAECRYALGRDHFATRENERSEVSQDIEDWFAIAAIGEFATLGGAVSLEDPTRMIFEPIQHFYRDRTATLDVAIGHPHRPCGHTECSPCLFGQIASLPRDEPIGFPT